MSSVSLGIVLGFGCWNKCASPDSVAVSLLRSVYACSLPVLHVSSCLLIHAASSKGVITHHRPQQTQDQAQTLCVTWDPTAETHSTKHIRMSLSATHWDRLTLTSLCLFFKEIILKPKYLIISSMLLDISRLIQAHQCAPNPAPGQEKGDMGSRLREQMCNNIQVCKAHDIFQEGKKLPV